MIDNRRDHSLFYLLLTGSTFTHPLHPSFSCKFFLSVVTGTDGLTLTLGKFYPLSSSLRISSWFFFNYITDLKPAERIQRAWDSFHSCMTAAEQISTAASPVTILSFFASTSSVLSKTTIHTVKDKTYHSLTNALSFFFLTEHISFIRSNCHCEDLNGPVLTNNVKMKVCELRVMECLI